MNIDTGKIKMFSEGQQIPERSIPINPNDMTKKQAVEMQVSKHDNRSKLGKAFGLNRAQRRAEMHKKKK